MSKDNSHYKAEVPVKYINQFTRFLRRHGITDIQYEISGNMVSCILDISKVINKQTVREMINNKVKKYPKDL